MGNVASMPQYEGIGKGIRTGAEFLSGLRDGRSVWTRGRLVDDVTSEPGMRRGVKTLAEMLDRQHADEYRDLVTYLDDDGIRCPMAYQTA